MCLFPTFASVKLIARGEGIGLVGVGLYVLSKYHPNSSELHWITLQQVWTGCKDCLMEYDWIQSHQIFGHIFYSTIIN